MARRDKGETTMASFDKADIEKLIDGVLPWPATQEMLWMMLALPSTLSCK